MSDLKFVVDYTDLQTLDRKLLDIEKTAKSSASVFEREYNKVERQLKKSTQAGQNYYNSMLRVDEQYKSAANSASVFEKQLIQNDRAWAKEAQRIETLKEKYNPLYRALKQYEATLDELKYAHAQGAISTERMGAAVKALDADYQAFQNGTAKWSNQFVAGADRAGKSLNKFGMYSQQFGYQFSDFLVQVQGGTNMFVAFGQQGAQLFGLISGPWGAALSIGAAAVGAFGAAWMRSNEQMEEAETGAKALEERVKSINATTEEYFRRREAWQLGLTPEELDQTKNIDVLRDKLNEAREALENYRDTQSTIKEGQAFEAFANLIGYGKESEYEELLKNLQEAQKAFREASQAEEGKALDASLKKALENQRKLEEVEVARHSARIAREQALTDFLADQNTEIERRQALAEVELYYGKESEEYERLIKEHQLDTYETLLDQAGVMGDMKDTLLTAYETMLGLEASARRTSELDLNNLRLGYRVKGATTDIVDGTVLDMGNGKTEVIDVKDKPRRRGGGGSGKSKETEEEYLGQLQREIALKKSLVGVFGTEADILTRVQQLKEQVIDKELKISDTQLEKIAKEEIALEQAIEKQQNLYESFSSSISSGLMDMVTGAQSVEDAFKGMIYNILETLYQQSVLDPIAQQAGSFLTTLLGFSNGGVIQGGKTIPFASGGIVHGASTFPMSGGKGLVGEAGPEAIMPLTRNSRGQLGVQTSGGNSGGGTTVVQVQLSPELIGQILQQAETQSVAVVQKASGSIVKQSVASVMNERRKGGAMKAAFG